MEIENNCTADVELPTNVSTEEQLALVPSTYLSDDPQKPLKLTDGENVKYNYSLKPMVYSVIFILIVEALERFSYYGINFTQTAYLTGEYSSWSAGLTGVQAAATTSLSTAIAYTAPFLGAILADALLGDFWVIALGASLFYVPGMVLIALTTIPGLLGETFNLGVLKAGLIVLYPLGAGCIKAVVNIFGAKQFHPVLQSSMLSRYYVNFYMFINIGALVGGIVIPIIAQSNVTVAYFIPVATMTMAIVVFVLGAPRYVQMRPNKTSLLNTLKIIGSSSMGCRGFDSSKSSNGGKYSDFFVQGVKQLLYIIPITALVVPFNVVYSQMATTFIVQGTVMKKVAFIDASMMQNVDAMSVLSFGFAIGQFFYPWLERRGIHIPTTYKFAMGTFCAVLSCVCALIIEYKIHSKYDSTGEQVNILWQTFPFFFIGAGEIFAISSAYEAAYKVAPKEQKALSSAINLFFIGGIPNFICMGIDNIVKPWFTNTDGSGKISTLESYSTTSIQNFWWMLIALGLCGCAINLLPAVSNWVTNVEEMAQENLIAFEKECATEVDLEAELEVSAPETETTDKEVVMVETIEGSTDDDQSGDEEGETEEGGPSRRLSDVSL